MPRDENAKSQNSRLMLAAAHQLAAEALHREPRYRIGVYGKDACLIEEALMKADELPEKWKDEPGDDLPLLLEELAMDVLERTSSYRRIHEMVDEMSVILIEDRAFDREGYRAYAITEDRRELFRQEVKQWEKDVSDAEISAVMGPCTDPAADE